MRRWHREDHRSERAGWLRAAVLGANDGIVSVAGLVVGVAATGASHATVLASGIAGVVAGAMSMAAGEYVSVQSQADTERADLAKETRELADDPDSELTELTNIYARRGLATALAREVAVQLTAHDALGSHARDELGLSEITRARPLQAALTSAAAFASGALPPVAASWLVPVSGISVAVAGGSLALLAVLGALAARLGGASLLRGALRVAFWGAIAMGTTALVGRLLGTAL